MGDTAAPTDEARRRIQAASGGVLRPAAAIATLAVATAFVVA